MAGFIRGVVLIGVMAVYSPVHLGNDGPGWTEGAALFGGTGISATSPSPVAPARLAGGSAAPSASSATEAMLALARENGPALARKLAELDPETRRLVLDMSLAAAARMQAESRGHGEARTRP